MADESAVLRASEPVGALELIRPGWDKRVIFDSHPPKGPQYHIDGDVIGVGIAWESLDKAMALFFKTVSRHLDIDPEEFR